MPTTVFRTEKGARLDVDERNKTIIFVDRKGATCWRGEVVLDAPAATHTITVERGWCVGPSPSREAIINFLRAATKETRLPHEVNSFFSVRKYGWPEAFCEIFRFDRTLFIVFAPKPSYWYALEHLRLFGVRTGDASEASDLLVRIRAEQKPDLLTSMSGQKGTYVHLVWVRAEDVVVLDRPTRTDISVGATWVGDSFASFGEHFVHFHNLAATVEPYGSVVAAARRFGAWLADQLIAGHTLYRVELHDGTLPLDKDAFLRFRSELAGKVMTAGNAAGKTPGGRRKQQESAEHDLERLERSASGQAKPERFEGMDMTRKGNEKGFSAGVLETPDSRATSVVFDASERFLVADTLVFEAGRPEPRPLGVEFGNLVAHPSKSLVAVLREDGVDFVALEGSRQVTSVKLKEVSCGAFNAKGNAFVVSCYYSHELRVFSLDGKLETTVPMPNSDDTAPAVCFGPGDKTLVALTGTQKMVTLPMDGSAPTERELPKVKVLSGNLRPVGADRLFFFDTANAAMLSYTGEVLWTARDQRDGFSIVPGADAIAVVRQNKKAIAFLSPRDGKELAALKIKIKVSPLGFSCSRNLAAWARDGAVELLPLPPLPAI